MRTKASAFFFALESVADRDVIPPGYWSDVPTVLHPAWKAVADLYPRIAGWQDWEPGEERLPGFVWDWQIALSMTVRGFGDDVTRMEKGWRGRTEYVLTPHGKVKSAQFGDYWYRFTLPPVLVPIDELDEGSLPLADGVDPSAVIAHYARTAPNRAYFEGLSAVLNGAH